MKVDTRDIFKFSELFDLNFQVKVDSTTKILIILNLW